MVDLTLSIASYILIEIGRGCASRAEPNENWGVWPYLSLDLPYACKSPHPASRRFKESRLSTLALYGGLSPPSPLYGLVYACIRGMRRTVNHWAG